MGLAYRLIDLYFRRAQNQQIQHGGQSWSLYLVECLNITLNSKKFHQVLGASQKFHLGPHITQITKSAYLFTG